MMVTQIFVLHVLFLKQMKEESICQLYVFSGLIVTILVRKRVGP